METTTTSPRLRWTLSRKISALLIGVGLCLLVISAVSFRSVGSLRTTSEMVDHTYQVLARIEAISSSLKDAETGQRGFLITGKRDYLAPYEAARGDLATEQQTLRTMTADNPAQQQRLDALAPLVQSKLDELKETIDLRAGAGGFRAALQVVLTDKGKAVMDDIRTVLSAMDNAERTLLAQRTSSASSSAGMVRSVILFGTGALLVLMGVAGTVLSRRIARPVHEVTTALRGLEDGDLTVSVPIRTTDELAVMATSLNAAGARLRETIGGRMKEAAGTLSGSARELSSISARLEAGAADVAQQATSATSASEEVSTGVQSIAAGAEQMSASIGEIASNAAQAAEIAQQGMAVAENTTRQVAELGAASTEVGDVVRLITSIAEQTNLLALNATIEAARAGELGKGFAVVAGEVKDLAQQTAKATEEITSRIGAIQGSSDSAARAIGEITDVIQRIGDYTTTIASAVEEQTATTGEMSRTVAGAAGASGDVAATVSQVSRVASSTADGAAATQRAAADLSRLAGDMTSIVNGFRY
ncbi:CHASE3 domain-containing protein [Actinoplanes sp. NPDC048796]|uniref:methyl-accepting chemotaxis protein n=1 Tax=unclassified Actinoplanes TaxID=2626549 RepID=UPI0033F526A2